MRLLVVGYSVRALAQSAWQAGYDVRAVDYFGDRDLVETVPTRSIRHDLDQAYRPEGLVELARSMEVEAVVYTGGLENHPSVVEELRAGRKLWGNDGQTLKEVRDWRRLDALFRQRKIAFPQVVFPGQAVPPGQWLSKPERGAGGGGIHRWQGESLRRGCYLQEFLRGPSGSATFLCDGKRASLVAVTEQLVGERAFTDGEFTWCGNLVPFESAEGDEIEGPLEEIGQALTETFGLRGLNGVDFILASRGEKAVPLPLEVNPRPTASLEVIEAALGRSLLPWHEAACRGELRQLPRPRKGFWGKAVVYARRELHLGTTEGWHERGRRDIPHDGEVIPARAPICTVLAGGGDREECIGALERAAGVVRRESGDEEGL